MSSRCYTPIYIKDKHFGTYSEVPCGKCPNCMKRKISGWSFRLRKESERSCAAHFLTLTYNTDNVPITSNGFMTLDKRDLQLFFKRLRKLSNQQKIKYYAVGEYGTTNKRPHYHIIIFNCDISKVEQAWAKNGKKMGEIHSGSVTPASVGYTLKYVSKKQQIPIHARDDRLKEFALVSKKMGDNYINEKTKQWHKNDLKNRMHLVIEDGKKIAMPRYYKEKIYTTKEKTLISLTMSHIAKEKEEQQRKQLGDRYEQNQLDIVQNAFNNYEKNIKRRL